MLGLSLGRSPWWTTFGIPLVVRRAGKTGEGEVPCELLGGLRWTVSKDGGPNIA